MFHSDFFLRVFGTSILFFGFAEVAEVVLGWEITEFARKVARSSVHSAQEAFLFKQNPLVALTDGNKRVEQVDGGTGGNNECMFPLQRWVNKKKSGCSKLSDFVTSQKTRATQVHKSSSVNFFISCIQISMPSTAHNRICETAQCAYARVLEISSKKILAKCKRGKRGFRATCICSVLLLVNCDSWYGQSGKSD